MATRFRLHGPLVLAFSAGLLVLPLDCKALNVTYGGTTYDLEIYTGSYNSQPSLFATPALGGRMPWWGDEALANGLASVLAGGLSPFPYPSQGPLFATALSFDIDNVPIVTASFYDLTTINDTQTVLTGDFSRASTQTYAVLAVPAPLPIAATTLWLSATKRLRRLSARLRRHPRGAEAPPA
jgi:hypothetical protein